MTLAGEEQDPGELSRVAGQILSQDARGRVLISREHRESLVAEYDRSGMSGVRFAQYLGIKYTTLAHWIRSRRRQRQREKLLMKAGADAEAGRSNGRWIEAVVDKNGSPARAPSGALRIYFAGGAYCQIGNRARCPSEARPTLIRI